MRSQYFLVGNFWLAFAIIAYVGKEVVGGGNVNAQVFGIGRYLTPKEYWILIATFAILALVCFALHCFDRFSKRR